MDISSIAVELPKYLSYGAIGLGAISMLLFLAVGRRETPALTQVLYVILSLAVVGSGVFLEWAKAKPVEQAHVDACTDAKGNFGQVVLRLDLRNKASSSIGQTLTGRRAPGDGLLT